MDADPEDTAALSAEKWEMDLKTPRSMICYEQTESLKTNFLTSWKELPDHE
jgi:hypothetical protein